jgi:hypothetical protein
VADLLDGLGVHRHLPADPLAGPCGHDAEVFDDETGVDGRTTELLVVGQRCALCLAAVDHEEPAQVTAVRIAPCYVHVLDPPVGLHPFAHLDELVEDLDGPFAGSP